MNWLTFVGEGRSGHTVLSGAIGSHPHARISEEQKYISRSLRGETPTEILNAVYTCGGGKARKAQGWEGLDSHSDPLMLVGDKCGWDAVNEFRRRGAPASIIGDFGDLIGMPVKTIVTVRHPADNIANWVQSAKYARMFPDPGYRQTRMIRRYRRFYSAAVDILQCVEPYTVYHEKFLEAPAATLEGLCEFLELPVDDQWMEHCLTMVKPKPNVRRDSVAWTEASKERIDWVIQNNPIMGFYR